MKKLLHKYVRRLLRWANTQSDEEIGEEQRRNAERRDERSRLERFVLSAAPFAPLPNTYACFCIWDLKIAGDIVERLKKDATFKQDHLDAHLQAIKDTGKTKVYLADHGLERVA